MRAWVWMVDSAKSFLWLSETHLEGLNYIFHVCMSMFMLACMCVCACMSVCEGQRTILGVILFLFGF